MRLFRRLGVSSGKTTRRRSSGLKKRQNDQVELRDCEAPRLASRRRTCEASHTMDGPDFQSLDDSQGLNTPARAALKAKKLAGMMLDPEELAEDQAQQKTLIEYMVKEATSMLDVAAAMDEHIDDDWLGGIDELPGNVYRIIAFGGLRTLEPAELLTMQGIQKMAEKLGLFAIFLIQLFAPPAVFFCNIFGTGVEKVLQWDEAKFGFMPDWTTDNLAYKILSALFIFLFCLNALSSSLDEAVSWVKIDKMFKFLKIPDDGNYWAVILDAFMNIWVVFWSVLDVFIVLLAEDSISDVLFDALSMTFLFNLDDIGGDLSFFGTDDWPGLQLGWIDQNMYKIAKENDDIDEPEHNTLVSSMYNVTTIYLTVMVFLLPAIFVCVNVPEVG